MQPVGVGAPASISRRPAVPSLDQRVHNPYRAPKPPKPLFKGQFETRPEGNSLGFEDEATILRLAPLYLWFAQGASIPLAAIVDVSFVEGDSFLRLTYWHQFLREDMSVMIRPRKFLNLGAKKGLEDFAAELHAARRNAPSREDFFGTSSAPSRYVTFRCEKGDSDPPAFIPFVSYLSVGIPVIAYLSKSTESQRRLCQKHGTRRGLLVSLRNGILGYFGIGGWLAAPIIAWANAQSLRIAYPESKTWIASLILGLTLPLTIAASLIVTLLIN